MAPNYNSIIKINNNKSKWCFFARVARLWTSSDSTNSEKSM